MNVEMRTYQILKIFSMLVIKEMESPISLTMAIWASSLSSCPQSSIKDEYGGMSEKASEIDRLYFSLGNLDFTPPTRTLMYCENNSKISISSNPIFHE